MDMVCKTIAQGAATKGAKGATQQKQHQGSKEKGKAGQQQEQQEEGEAVQGSAEAPGQCKLKMPNYKCMCTDVLA